jgi:hypothetical protein
MNGGEGRKLVKITHIATPESTVHGATKPERHMTRRVVGGEEVIETCALKVTWAGRS